MSWAILNPKTAGQNGLVRCKSTLTLASLMSTSSINSNSVIVVLISGSTICDNSSKIFTRSCFTSCAIVLNP